MTVKTIGGTKGGSGKTTIATNIAAFLAKEGVRFALVDTDVQKSSSKWNGRREATRETHPGLGLNKVVCVEATGKNTMSVIREMEQQYGLVIVDAGGADSQELRSAIVASDDVYVPFKPSMLDLETLEPLEEIRNMASSIGRDDIRFHAILGQAPATPTKTELFEAKAYLEAYEFITIEEEVIRDRAAYRLAIRDGRGVVDMPKAGEARAEIELLCYQIFKEILQ